MGRGFVVAAVVAVVAAVTTSEPAREGPPPDWYVQACQISDAC